MRRTGWHENSGSSLLSGCSQRRAARRSRQGDRTGARRTLIWRDMLATSENGCRQVWFCDGPSTRPSKNAVNPDTRCISAPPSPPHASLECLPPSPEGRGAKLNGAFRARNIWHCHGRYKTRPCPCFSASSSLSLLIHDQEPTPAILSPVFPFTTRYVDDSH